MAVTNKVIILSFVLGIFLPLVYSKQINFYRKDYYYSETLDAFYKLHSDSQGSSWDSAFLACDDEGAELFYPKSKDETYLIKALASEVGDRNVTEILTGLHDKFGLGEFITVDGHATESSLSVEEPDNASQRLPSGHCVLYNIYTESYRVGPCTSKDLVEPMAFVCKKVEIREGCPTIDSEYKYVQSLRKCYKINKRPKTWNDAMQTCYLEGGILTVIKNGDEANALSRLLAGQLSTKYHVGNRKIGHSDEFYTVNGQKQDGMYLQIFDENQNYDNEGNENEEYDCGAVYYNSRSDVYTTTTKCSAKRPFICEMPINQ